MWQGGVKIGALSTTRLAQQCVEQLFARKPSCLTSKYPTLISIVSEKHQPFLLSPSSLASRCTGGSDPVRCPSPPSPTPSAHTFVSQYACCWEKIKINIKDGPEREKKASKSSTHHKSSEEREEAGWPGPSLMSAGPAVKGEMSTQSNALSQAKASRSQLCSNLLPNQQAYPRSQLKLMILGLF